jgi:RNA polymerase sigma-70 factor, ECF subfamily
VCTGETGTGHEFVCLYQRTVGDVYSYLASRLSDHATAEDLTQEVFIAGAHRATAGEVVDVPWLIGVARHKLIDHWRGRAREDRKLERAHSSRPSSDVAMPASIDVGPASAALARLNPTYRAALVLRHVDDLPVPAVAAHLGRSIEATEQVLTRARAAFRAMYRELTDD